MQQVTTSAFSSSFPRYPMPSVTSPTPLCLAAHKVARQTREGRKDGGFFMAMTVLLMCMHEGAYVCKYVCGLLFKYDIYGMMKVRTLKF